ncbi:MAG TPA: penicillin-binding protein activator [Gammaproteobacteria bacterium]|nr:penicillin-binding protein activator [Gammaproteobacteria bacterium]
MPNTTLSQLLILLCLSLSIISSCGVPTKEKTTTQGQQQEQQAQAYLDAGDYIAAAETYQALADNSESGQANAYNLLAAESYFSANEYGRAQALITQLSEREPSPPIMIRSRILAAKIAIAQGDSTLALSSLDFNIPNDISIDLLASYFAVRARAHALDNQPVQALQDRDRLGQYLQTPAEINANNSEMWSLLNQFSTETLTKESFAEQSSPRLIGWYDLAIIRKTLIYDQAALQTALENWKEQYPGHPAAGTITEDIIELARKTDTTPQHIALLLPFNDTYRDASEAIREGFLAAWYETPGKKPAIRIYDSALSSITDVYQAAVADGADFVVGPLQKETVADLISSAEIQVTTLALNQVQVTNSANSGSSTVSDRFFQFGLLPEDEATQAADRAWSEGHSSALIITPDSIWGKRIYDAFTTHWQELGGQIAEQVQITSSMEDYSLPVKQLLNIDKSEERSKLLIATLHRNIVSEPRHRRDADMIFMAVSSVTARQLVPQLRFYRADDIPTYSISTIYSGIFNPQVNADIDNVMFADMPWILSPEYEYSPMQQALNHAWNQDESPYRRLYAFGIDAYQIIPELGRLRATQDTYRGKTGRLTVSSNNIIQRRSMWAQFVKGTPRLLDVKSQQ